MRAFFCKLLLAFALLAPLSFATSAYAAPSGRLEQHTVMADGHPLALWAREVRRPRGVIVLLHGRTWSALPDFDLQVPGEPRSVMQALNAQGYSAFALDLRGYGKTPRDATGWWTPDRAARDLTAAIEWLAQEKHLVKPTLLGWSNGSVVALLMAQRRPELISNLILYGFPRDVAAPPVVQPVPERPAREVNTRKRAVADFISPQAISRKVIDAYVAAALSADPVRVDIRATEQWGELDPAKVITPTLVLQGERDPLAPIPAQANLFTRLGTPDRQWVVLPGVDHAALIEDSQPAFIAAIVAFVARPH
jgi:alpha-beta hydrolase superfamily lysophospholipase